MLRNNSVTKIKNLIPYNNFVRITEAMRAYVQIGEHQFELGDDARRGFQRLTNSLNGK